MLNRDWLAFIFQEYENRMVNLRDNANSRGKTLLLKSILKEKALEYISSCFCAIKNGKF